VVIVDVDAQYLVSNHRDDPLTNGWPLVGGGGNLLQIRFPLYLRNPNGNGLYWNWTTNKTDHTMDIIILGGLVPEIGLLGGLVPEIGLGQRIIHTTYPQQLIENDKNTAAFPNGACLSNFSVQNPPAGCDGPSDGVNQYIFENKVPQVFVTPEGNATDPFDAGIPAYYHNYGDLFSLQICAYDPEGDPNISFSLIGAPEGMSSDTLSDANCVQITWTPASPTRPGIYRNIKLQARDSDWAFASYPFTMIVTDTPGSPTGYSLHLDAGWSMVSLPAFPTNSRAGSLFPGYPNPSSGVVAIFKYSTQDGYILLGPNDDMAMGTGYWIFSPFSGTYEIYGYPVDEWTITDVPPGWSMIGGCTDPATASVEHGRIRGIFGFANRYVHLGASDTLQPGKGFWINITESSNLNLDTP